MSKKYVYAFSEGNAGMRDLLGGKGANLAEMTRLGLPVPPGFIITTEACNEYTQVGHYPPGLDGQVETYLDQVEVTMGKKLGDPENPLLISVRSGAKYSMPGMMDTILNLGLNDITLERLVKKTSNRRFVLDSYRRFIQMFGSVVMGVEKDKFEHALIKLKEDKGLKTDIEMTEKDLDDLIVKFKEIVKRETGKGFPDDPREQLDLSIKAVFSSWMNERAISYRNHYGIPHDLGTACSIQVMVFGNMGNDSATGVAFTRNPSTGEKKLYGEYLINAQGEDVVAGVRTPQPIEKLSEEMPEVYNEFASVAELLEKHYKEVQDMEFTIERGKLYTLQTRNGKRTAVAAIKIAVDMVEEGLITEKEAINRIDPNELDQLLHPQIDPNAEVEVLAKGLNASPGAATGKVIFDADLAEELGSKGENVILTRWQTNPDDIHGMIAARGILTSEGGMTSHAAVVARGMGKPAVCGAEAIRIDIENRLFNVDGKVVNEGDLVTIDGGTGRVIIGEVPLVAPAINEDFQQILRWADEYRSLGVKTNADNGEDAAKARQFGAEGIGLCRTEHMFLGEERLPHVQRMILAKTEEERQEEFGRIQAMQKSDFIEIFRAMDGLPVTIRLLDPPLHEFLPKSGDLRVEIVEKRQSGASEDEIAQKEALLHAVRNMEEANPMLGLRGCRLGIIFPGLYEMQAKAIMEAALDVIERGGNPLVEIMIPLVSEANELKLLKPKIEEAIKEIFAKRGMTIPYKLGTMIELPRAALTADEIAKYADFFSFGTNDLTQTTYGFSRDDAEGKFFAPYLSAEIFLDSPFEILDEKGVGQLVEMACQKGRSSNPNLVLGICGEHGGDPKSVKFFHKAGLDYVSCSPYRVPLARLAAAQAVLEREFVSTTA